MKTSILTIAVTAALLPILALAQSQVPERISYQGIVSDGGTLIGTGSPVNRVVQFRIWDAATGGTLKYSETQTVTIAEGEFSVLVGGGSDISGEEATGPGSTSISEAFDGAARFLSVTVDADGGGIGNDAEISPRQQIVTTAFAFRAKEAEMITGGTLSGGTLTGTINSSGATFNGGSFTGNVSSTSFSGNGANLTTLNATNLSSGTLAEGRLTPNVALLNRSPQAFTGAINSFAGKVGIGMTNPSRATIEQQGSDVTAAIFGANTTGIGLWGNFPSIGFNSYFNGGAKAIGAGFTGSFFMNPNIGAFELRTGNNVAKDAEATMTTRLTVLNNGNVGIGTSNPSTRLTVQTPTNSLGFRHTDGTVNLETIVNPTGAQIGTGTNHSLGFFTNNGGKMMILANGNVGIGTDTPGAAFHVKSHTNNVDDNTAIFEAEGISGSVDSHIHHGPTGDIYWRSALHAGKVVLQDLGGNVGIGTATPEMPLHIFAGGTSNPRRMLQMEGQGFKWAFEINGNGNLHFARNGVVRGWVNANGGFDSPSDRRLKKDIEGVGSVLDKVMQLEPVSYRMKTTADTEKPTYGFIAQDVEPLFPNVVVDNIQNLGISYTSMIPLAFGAIQELKLEHDDSLNALRSENAALKEQLAKQAKKLAVLEETDKARDVKLAAIETLLKTMVKSPDQPELVKVNAQ